VDRIIRWAPAEGVGAEHLSVRGTAGGVVAEGVVVGAHGGTPYGLRYRVACDALWRVREAVLGSVKNLGRMACLSRADRRG